MISMIADAQLRRDMEDFCDHRTPSPQTRQQPRREAITRTLKKCDGETEL